MLVAVSKRFVTEHLGPHHRDIRVAEDRRGLRLGEPGEVGHDDRMIAPVRFFADDGKRRTRPRERIGFPDEAAFGNADLEFDPRFSIAAVEYERFARIAEMQRLRRRLPRHAHVRERAAHGRYPIRKVGLVDDRDISDLDARGRAVGGERRVLVGNAHRPKESRCRDRRMKIVDALTATRIGRDRRSLEEGQSKMQERSGLDGPIGRDIRSAHQANIGRGATEAETIPVRVGSHAFEIVTACDIALKVEDVSGLLTWRRNLVVTSVSIEPRNRERISRAIDLDRSCDRIGANERFARRHDASTSCGEPDACAHERTP